MRSVAAVDLFCGAGGLTWGFRQAGIYVAAGVDIDPTCRFPFETNNPQSKYVLSDVACLRATEVSSWFPKDSIRVLAGCAPCQPFSTYTIKRGVNGRWPLLYNFLRLVREVRPDVVSMENVPALKRYKAYADFVEGLESAGYAVQENVIRCADYGVPQTRERLVVLAGAKKTRIHMVTLVVRPPPTVRAAIGELPAIKAGAPARRDDPLHASSRLSPLNLKRIRATPEGGGWSDWPSELRLDCHERETGRYYGSVYGRMAWEGLAPTITTQCFGYGNGRFGHPEQDRAISLREAALLQTFPRTYLFTSPGERPTFKNVGRHIGNAVPVALAVAIGKSIMQAHGIESHRLQDAARTA